MECERVREQLLLHVSDDLDPAEASAVEGHLEECPACREAREALAAVFAAFASPGPRPMPPAVRDGFWGDLRDRLREEGVVRPAAAPPARIVAIRPLLGGLLAAGVLVGAFLLGWYLDAASTAPGDPGEGRAPGPTAEPGRPGPEPGPPALVVQAPSRTEFALPNGRADRRQKDGEEVYVETVLSGTRRPERSVEYEIDQVGPRRATPVTNVDF